MRYIIASDIHGSAHWCGRLLETFGKEGADRLLLLGDIDFFKRGDNKDEYIYAKHT